MILKFFCKQERGSILLFSHRLNWSSKSDEEPMKGHPISHFSVSRFTLFYTFLFLYRYPLCLYLPLMIFFCYTVSAFWFSFDAFSFYLSLLVFYPYLVFLYLPLYHTVWWPQQEVTRPKARFNRLFLAKIFQKLSNLVTLHTMMPTKCCRVNALNYSYNVRVFAKKICS